MCVRERVTVCVCVCVGPNLRVEEYLWSQEALVSHVDGELFLADGVDASVLLDPLGSVRIILAELLHQIRTDVTEALLQQRDRDAQRLEDETLMYSTNNTLTLSHTDTHTLPHTHTLTLSHTHSLTHTHSRTHTHSLSP